MAWTTPRTWVSGEVVTAALLNTHIRDNLNAIGNAWTSYTPTWTGSVSNPTIGNGTLTGAYMQAGKYTTYRVRIVMGSTTTFGSGEYRISYPFTAAGTGGNNPGSSGYIFRSSTWSVVIAVGYSTTALRMVATAANTMVAHNSPIIFANGDEIHVGGTYEAA